MPSAATACMSASAVTTTLWPMAATGILPVWLSVILNSVHEAGMVIEPTLYCIASLPSITVAQSVTTAAGLPLAAAGAADSVAAGSVAGAGSGVATAGSAVCAGASAGAVVSVVSGDCPPHAAR